MHLAKFFVGKSVIVSLCIAIDNKTSLVGTVINASESFILLRHMETNSATREMSETISLINLSKVVTISLNTSGFKRENFANIVFEAASIK